MTTVINQISFRDVLHARANIGHINKMFDLAKTLGYPYFIWNERVYKAGDESYNDTGLMLSNVL